jgi:hypothetical protein
VLCDSLKLYLQLNLSLRLRLRVRIGSDEDGRKLPVLSEFDGKIMATGGFF